MTEPQSVDFGAVASNLEAMSEKKDIQALARMAVAVASVMNKKSQEGTDESKAVSSII